MDHKKRLIECIEALNKHLDLKKADSQAYADARSNQKGVQKPAGGSPGRSVVGFETADARATANPAHKEIHQTNAKSFVKDAINSLKAMPKPNLPKSEVMAKAKEDLSVAPEKRNAFREAKRDMPGQNDFLANQVTSQPGVSDRGIEVRRADAKKDGVLAHGYARVSTPGFHLDRAKKIFNAVRKLQAGIPKPNLPKSEAVQKSSEKGVHQADYKTQYIKDGKTQHGISTAGIKTREAANPSTFEEYEDSPKVARAIHSEKLKELKAMPKPNLPKSEEMAKNTSTINGLKTGTVSATSPVKPAKEKKQKIAATISMRTTGMPSMGAMSGVGGLARSEDIAKADIKGVHSPVNQNTPGTSAMGQSNRGAAKLPLKGTTHKQVIDAAKRQSKANLANIQAMPKPNLPKSEEMAKAKPAGYGKTSYHSQLLADTRASKQAKTGQTAFVPSTPKPSPGPITKPTTLFNPDMSGKIDYKKTKLAASEDEKSKAKVAVAIDSAPTVINRTTFSSPAKINGPLISNGYANDSKNSHVKKAKKDK